MIGQKGQFLWKYYNINQLEKFIVPVILVKNNVKGWPLCSAYIFSLMYRMFNFCSLPSVGEFRAHEGMLTTLSCRNESFMFKHTMNITPTVTMHPSLHYRCSEGNYPRDEKAGKFAQLLGPCSLREYQEGYKLFLVLVVFLSLFIGIGLALSTCFSFCGLLPGNDDSSYLLLRLDPKAIIPSSFTSNTLV